MEIKTSSEKPNQIVAVFANTILFLIPAMALLVDWTTFRLALLLSLLGAIGRLTGRVSTTGPTPSVLYALPALALVVAGLTLYHDDPWGSMHLPIAILLLLPIYWAAKIEGVEVRWAFFGAIIGAVIGLYVALSNGGLSGNRYNGIFNPIPTGGIALLLACASAMGLFLRPWALPKAVWGLMCVLGVFAGIATSILSGSKSGWIALPVVPVVLMVTQWRSISNRWRFKALTIFVVGIVVTAFALNASPFGPRVADAIHGMQHYLTTGKPNEGSVGPRLELWRYAVENIGANVWIGFGKNGFIAAMTEATKAGLYAPVIATLKTLHNEFLHVYIVNGLLSLAALIFTYVSVFRLGLGRERRSEKSVALMAICLGTLYLCLGVGEVAVQLRDLRNPFLFWVILLAAQPAARAVDRSHINPSAQN